MCNVVVYVFLRSLDVVLVFFYFVMRKILLMDGGGTGYGVEIIF